MSTIVGQDIFLTARTLIAIVYRTVIGSGMNTQPSHGRTNEATYELGYIAYSSMTVASEAS